MRHRRSIVLLVVVSTLLGIATPIAGAEPAPRPRGSWSGPGELTTAETRTDLDAVGDVNPCNGDITQFGAGYGSAEGEVTRNVVLAVETACANDVNNDNAWVVGLSYVAWYLDTDEDGYPDYWVFMENAGGTYAEVYDVTGENDEVVCAAQPLLGGGGNTYLMVRLDAGCIRSPRAFRVHAELQFDRSPGATSGDACANCSLDDAPDRSWGPLTAYTGSVPRQGYWMVGRTGETFAFGAAQHHGNTPSSDVVDLEPTASGDGYWTVNARGNVFGAGDAGYFGGSPSLAAGEAVTALSRTANGGGYWLFTNRGRVIPFGNAPFLGDMSGTRLNGPVLDSIPTSSGQGYYMVGSDGGIFTFGDAQFFGSTGDMKLNAPVQSLVPDLDGSGYWLVASDGGIFAFAAEFYGSMGSTRLNKPVTGMVGFGNGYLMVGEDGGIFTFGEAPFFGSLGDNPPAQPIVSVAILNQ